MADSIYSVPALSRQDRRSTSRYPLLIMLANTDGLRWEARLDEGVVERSPFARAFLDMVASH